MLSSFGLSGCGVGKAVGAIRRVSHEVSGNKATIDEFTSDLKSAPKAHWVVFLREFALAAGFAGDKISTSNLTVNGFSMHCVDFKTPGVTGLSKICTTTQGILATSR